jgi:hypothetical protein
MDEHRKNAYRHLLYRAMLDIRGLGNLPVRGARSWSPWFWRRAARPVQRAGAIADWLHNLAHFSANDFEGFDEELFWQSLQWYRERFPEFDLGYYREEFDRYLAQPEKAAAKPI